MKCMNEENRREFFLKNYKTMTYEEMSKPMGFKNGEVVRSWAKDRKMPNKRINSQSKRVVVKDKNQLMLDKIKVRGYTEHQLKEMSFPFEKALEIAEKEKDYTAYVQRNEFNERVLVLIRKPEKEIKVLPRAFEFSVQPEGQPYLWVKFPHLKRNKDIDKIEIFPFADLHYGHKSCDKDSILQDIEWVRTHENIYAVGMGDLIENASKLSVASGVYEQDSMPSAQIDEICKLLSPIAHKFLFMVQGNHEERTYRHLGIDIGKVIADRLNVPYFSEPVYMDMLWRNYRWTIFAQHGASASRTKGGKLNAASRPLKWTEFTNFILYAHVHDKLPNEVIRIVRDPVNFRLLLKKQYVIVCSAYLGYFGTYAARSGYEPSSRGRLSLNIYSNGKYFVKA
jgi:hypothetical protein